MANPQIEDGYTKIANEILEALTRVNLSGHEFRIALLIIRRTYGFSKKEDAISLTQMVKNTGLSKTRCSQVVNSLGLQKIVTVTENINGIGKKYRFNKDYDKWDTVTKKCNRYKKVKSTVTKKCNHNINLLKEKHIKHSPRSLKREFSQKDEAYRLSEVLFNLILKNNPHSRLHACQNGDKELIIQRWAKDIDLLIRKDRQQSLIVEEVIRWCQQDDFWGPNVQSGAKLREKWDTLVAQMRRKGVSTSAASKLGMEPREDEPIDPATGNVLKTLPITSRRKSARDKFLEEL